MAQVFSLRVRIFGVILAVVHAPVYVSGSDSDPPVRPGEPAVAPVTSQTSAGEKSKTEQFVTFYLEMYGKHLKSKDWVARAMAVIGLARIDDPRTTERLLEVMEGDKSQIVRVYAWEALHARQDRLTSDQRVRWTAAAFQLAEKNAFRGDLRLGLVGLMNAAGPSPGNKKLFKGLFGATNSMDPNDIRTLWAMGDALKRWQSPDLIKGLIDSMSKLDDAYRAELVLRRVNPSILRKRKLILRGSKVMWATTKQRWNEWFKQAGLKEINPPEGPPYAGLSAVMPRGEKITKTRDAKWRKDLELVRCRLGRLEVCFVIDSTGSMGPAVQWIQRDVIKMMRAFEMISREPRIGVILYRDHGDKHVVQSIPLLGSARRLARTLRKATAEGGGDANEAVYEALCAAVNRKQKWSKGSTVRKVVILVGDAPPHKETMGEIERLVTSASKRGFGFYCIKVSTLRRSRDKRPDSRRDLSAFDKIAEWGGGRSLWVRFTGTGGGLAHMKTAKPVWKDSSERILLREILKVVLKEGYRDRVAPFVGVLLEYVETPVKEKRIPFKPSRLPRIKPSPSDPGPTPDPQKQ